MLDTFLNGEYYKSDEARVSIEDRGFLFGDGIYEVVRIYNGHYFELGQHLARLERSARKTFLTLPYELSRIETICHELLQKSGIANGKLYMQITRGSAPRTHEFPLEAAPTILLKVSEVNENQLRKNKIGVTALTLPDERWNHCDIKSLNLLPNVLAKQQARSQGYYEAIFVHGQEITEGASSNVFVVLDHKLTTAPESNRILLGITRNVVIELAAEAGIPVEERFVTLEELPTASELFITSTVDEITPVLSIDGHTLNGAVAGEITGQMQTLFQQKLSMSCR